MDVIPDNIIAQYKLLFGSDNDGEFTFVKKEAMSGRIRYYKLRTIVWQVLLKTVEYDSELKCLKWKESLKTSRELYEELKDKHFVDPHKSENCDPNVNNPLSTESDSIWAQYFKNKELQQEIDKDVSRTFPDIEFFRDQNIQKIMNNILFVYCKENPKLGYKQGMHELLAPILYTVMKESNLKIEESEEDKEYFDLLTTILDKDFIENDSFTIFNKVMEKMAIWFFSSHPENEDSDNLLQSDENETRMTPIIQKCKHIQDTLLMKYDKELCLSLKEKEIEPQLYLLKWIRVLFGREFHLEDSMVVWDGIFSFDENFSLIDYLSVAMLIFIRSQLIERDFAGCIKRLQKYPPVEDITILIEHAIAISNSTFVLPKPKPIVNHQIVTRSIDNKAHKPPKKIIARDLKSLSKPTKTKAYNPTTIHVQPQQIKKTPIKVPNQIETDQKQDVETVIPKKKPVKKQEVPKELGKRSKILKHNLEQIGNQLNDLVEYLRGELSKHPDSKLATSVVQTIAELKRIRDLSYGLIEGEITPIVVDNIKIENPNFIEVQKEPKKSEPKPQIIIPKSTISSTKPSQSNVSTDNSTKIDVQSQLPTKTFKYESKPKNEKSSDENEEKPAEVFSTIFDDPLGLFSN